MFRRDRSAAVPPSVRGERETLAYYLSIPTVWGWQFFHNTQGILCVLDITRFRPLPAGLISLHHPWATGLNPATGAPIWHENVLYRSPRPAGDVELPDDDAIVQRVGEYLAQMAALSAIVPEIPWGPRRRMPHGINYIHGSAHYNSGILVFTDFADAIGHFTDRRFAAEVHRFVRRERREVFVMFRQREYSPREYAYYVGCMRTLFPWFCNSNGPLKRVLWGNPSPFPVANIITGNWIRDIYRLKRPGGAAAVVRPPIRAGEYFRHAPYRGCRREPLWPEKLLAQYTHWRIRLRGARGGLFFVDRRKLLADKLAALRQLGIADEPIARL
ncbi:MAG TPA: hypothetical protein VH643_41370 [Gemmataceae bacterium]|jgi:hypothetical protein